MPESPRRFTLFTQFTVQSQELKITAAPVLSKNGSSNGKAESFAEKSFLPNEPFLAEKALLWFLDGSSLSSCLAKSRLRW